MNVALFAKGMRALEVILILVCIGFVVIQLVEMNNGSELTLKPLKSPFIRVYKSERRLEILEARPEEAIYAFKIALGRSPVGHKRREKGTGKL
jgi:murein L,D-transpeptidase YafK